MWVVYQKKSGVKDIGYLEVMLGFLCNYIRLIPSHRKEATMSVAKTASSLSTLIDPNKVRTAITKLAGHKLYARMRRMDHNEAHWILPEIWPVINELCLVADACEAGMIRVNEKGPRRATTDEKFQCAGHKPENERCDHKHWTFTTNGRYCTCGTYMVDYGD